MSFCRSTITVKNCCCLPPRNLGTYDPVDIRKQDFTRAELSDYIAADGKITVRYSGGNDAENGTSQALPLLMVTGREN